MEVPQHDARILAGAWRLVSLHDTGSFDGVFPVHRRSVRPLWPRGAANKIGVDVPAYLRSQK